MKWPCVQVPKTYWKVWEAILKTSYMSASVSGFFPDQMIRKHLFWFLQSTDRKHLLSKIGRNQYHVYILDAFSRNKYIYSRQQIHSTVRCSLVGFRGVQVQIFDDVIVTDGNAEPNSNFQSSQTPIPVAFFTLPLIVQQLENERRRNYMILTTTIYNKPIHMELPPTEDARILEFYDGLATLDPMLQRNLGRIVEISNIPELVKGIEDGQVLAVAYASLGARDPAAHAYTISTMSGKTRITGEAPINCDPDDIKSTRSETCGMIAIQTLINVFCETFELSCDKIIIYCDNLDALCKNKPEIMLMSYPRFFRPNVDMKNALMES